MTLAALAVVPAAPLLLPAVSPAQPGAVADAVAALRADVAATLGTLRARPLRSVVLLAGGDEVLLHAASSATLGSYGLPDVAAPIGLDRELLAELGARSQAPSIQEEALHGDLAVLALLLAAAHPGLPVVPLTVPWSASRPVLDGLASGLVRATGAVDGEVAVLATGDLAATLDTTSPGYLVDGAPEVDAAAVAALRDGDEEAFAALGPAEAARVQARGWAPLTVLLAAGRLTDLRLAEVTYHAPRGVGQVVGWPAATAEAADESAGRRAP
jgi:hypothetical protein